MKDTSSVTCSAVIPIDNENGIECRGPFSVMTEEGPRCTECFIAFGGTLVESSEQPKPFDLGSLMCMVIDRLTGWWKGVGMKRHLTFWLCVIACILFLSHPQTTNRRYGHRTGHHRMMHRYEGAK